MGAITIEPITKRNWEEAMAIGVCDSQKSFVPSVAECLAFAYLKPWDEALDPYVLLVDKTIIGVFYLSYTPDSKDNYWIGGFQIDKRHQGKGYGKQALLQIVKFIKERHPVCCLVSLTVEKDNLHAILLYEKFGFTSEKKENEYAEVIYSFDLEKNIFGIELTRP